MGCIYIQQEECNGGRDVGPTLRLSNPWHANDNDHKVDALMRL